MIRILIIDLIIAARTEGLDVSAMIRRLISQGFSVEVFYLDGTSEVHV